MNHKTIRATIIGFSSLAVFYPLWVVGSRMVWALDGTLVANLFPLFGIAAFSILWLHIVGPSLRPWLDKYVDFQNFLDRTESFILVFMLAHPISLLLLANFDVKLILSGGTYIIIGIVGLLLLLTFDLSKAMKKRNFVERHWEKILFISTAGFILIFFHSIMLGSDLQEGPLRVVWLFYGVTAIASAVWNYGVKRFLN